MGEGKECKRCAGERWVCENHRDKPWNDFGCQCGAGDPCPDCNIPDDPDDAPYMPPETLIVPRTDQ